MTNRSLRTELAEDSFFKQDAVNQLCLELRRRV